MRCEIPSAAASALTPGQPGAEIAAAGRRRIGRRARQSRARRQTRSIGRRARACVVLVCRPRHESVAAIMPQRGPPLPVTAARRRNGRRRKVRGKSWSKSGRRRWCRARRSAPREWCRTGPPPSRRGISPSWFERDGDHRIHRIDAAAHRVRGADLHHGLADDDADRVGSADDGQRGQSEPETRASAPAESCRRR